MGSYLVTILGLIFCIFWLGGGGKLRQLAKNEETLHVAVYEPKIFTNLSNPFMH
jgi:hypothetical protein